MPVLPRGGEPSEAELAPASDNPVAALQERLKLAEEQLVPLVKLTLPRFLKPQQFVWPFLVLGLGGRVPARGDARLVDRTRG